jgi:hypothetical protein
MAPLVAIEEAASIVVGHSADFRGHAPGAHRPAIARIDRVRHCQVISAVRLCIPPNKVGQTARVQGLEAAFHATRA